MVNQPPAEFWQKGPIPGIPPLLQPVAHALLQARKEVMELMDGFPPDLLWEKPAGMASPAFHLHHLAGVLDRLFTYARALPLSPRQLDYLKNEGKPANGDLPDEMLRHFNQVVDAAIDQLGHTPEHTLTEPRGIGRQQIPTTVIGLLFHAAEHTTRHTGQLIVTVRVLMERKNNPGTA